MWWTTRTAIRVSCRVLFWAFWTWLSGIHTGKDDDGDDGQGPGGRGEVEGTVAIINLSEQCKEGQRNAKQYVNNKPDPGPDGVAANIDDAEDARKNNGKASGDEEKGEL